MVDYRVKGVHVKDFKKSVGNIHSFVNLLEGDIEWDEELWEAGKHVMVEKPLAMSVKECLDVIKAVE